MKTLIYIALSLIALSNCFSQNRNGIPLSIGDTIPLVSLGNMEGKTVKLQEEIGGAVSVIIFYRGGWCPFCNAHLSDLQDIHRSLKKKGVKLLAISPESTNELEKTKDNNGVGYNLYTDNNGAALKFGVATLQNGKASLPTPSVFVVDAQGVVQFVHYDPNYKERLEARIILDKVESILKKK